MLPAPQVSVKNEKSAPEGALQGNTEFHLIQIQLRVPFPPWLSVAPVKDAKNQNSISE